uniref:C2H2-type domain-containing protein n=1 Tax=Meloidogyne enterolobii TaxID=390850 RepID=A0A6V7TIG5_MELEN|nr:unnamed protein product [Meloidogyne enterolobii]
MLNQNCCSFTKIDDGQISSHGEKCGLYFKNLLELIHHIEEDHIPLIENAKIAERKRLREQFVDDPEQYEKAYNASLNQPVPLSLVCRLKPFPKGHKVHPITTPKQRTLKFCHYKPKQIVQQQLNSVVSNVVQTTASSLTSEILATSDPNSLSTISKRMENQHNRPREASTSSGCVTPDLLSGCQSPGQQLLSGFEERKYRCAFDGCLKTYKNQQGLRQHMRTSHSSSLEHSLQMSSKLSASEEGILSRQFPGRQSPFLSSSMVFNSPISTTDSSTSQKITVIQEAPFLVTTVSSVSLPVNVPSVGNTLLKDCKYQCQQCASTGNEFKVFKTLTSLNKHLRETHGAVTLSPSRYPPGQHQKLIQIYSPQQSPQRPMSVGSSQQVSIIQPQSSGSFITPTLAIPRQNTSQQQSSSTSLQSRLSRPSAPIPPSTPPSPYSTAATLVSASPTSYSYSPQKYQNIQQQHRRQNLFTVSDNTQGQQQHVMGSGIHHYYSTSNVQTAPIDQQPPVLQPQQQTAGSQRFLRYTYQQPDQQQIYSSSETTPAYPYSSIGGIENNNTGTTTIYVTHQQQPPQHIGQQQPNYRTNQCQVEYEQDNFGRTFYRQQPEIQHYLVEPTGQQQGSGTYSQPNIQVQQPNGTRLTPTTSVTTLRAVPIGGNISSQQVGTLQQFHQPVYEQPRGNVYGESTQQQQPYTNTIRTTPVQSQQQRIFQQNQFYNQQRSQTQGNRRQSPVTVAAILAETSP